MSNKKLEIKEKIKKSKLTDTDKREFISYLSTLTDNNLKKIIETFNDNYEELANFWLNLRARMILLQLVENSENFSETEKEKTKKSIIDMTDEEFYACVHTMRTEAKTDPVSLNKKIKKLLKVEEVNHRESMKVASIISKKMLKRQIDRENIKDAKKYKEFLKKIKG